MRARMRRRERMRKLTIVITVVAVAASLGVGIYFAETSMRGTSLDLRDGQPVSTSDLAGMRAASLSYGPAPTAAMQAAANPTSGSPFLSGGKPTVVYVGGEYCQYCAAQRWALIVALERFGNFTGLKYMTSAANEGDLPTFTFVGSGYVSSYVGFRPFEYADRSDPPKALQTVPSNYSAVWKAAGGGVPFIDFGNSYVVAASLVSDTSALQGKDWSAIIGEVASGSGVGIQVGEAANMISALICKIDNGQPAAVCSAGPVASALGGLYVASPTGMSQALATAPAARGAEPPIRVGI